MSLNQFLLRWISKYKGVNDLSTKCTYLLEELLLPPPSILALLKQQNKLGLGQGLKL